MADFFSRLLADPRKAIDAASITRVDELGNGYDDWNNLIAPKFEQPQQTWGETALGVATAPARLATALAGSVSPYGQEGWQVPPVAQEGWNALTAVGDAYTQGMSEDEMRNRALGMAGFMMAGGGPAAALEKSLAPRPVSVRGYHGTRSDFDKFNGPSVFASENPDAASEWAMVANREGDGPNVLPLDITASNPYYAKSLFPDQAERDRIVRADPDVVFYPPSTQHGTTFDTHSGRVFEARKPGTVRSATTGETLFANASKESSIPAIASALDMSPEARLARAKEMGFDTDTTWYHGTDRDFPAFDASKIGENTGDYATGFHFTSDPDIAARAARVGRGSDEGSAVMPAYVRSRNPYIADYPDENPVIAHDLDRNHLYIQARRGGHDGILVRGADGEEHLVAFDPKNIRSVNAAFDPAKSDSANLLAVNADSKPALLASALGQEQIDPERIKAAIRNRMRGDK